MQKLAVRGKEREVQEECAEEFAEGLCVLRSLGSVHPFRCFELEIVDLFNQINAVMFLGFADDVSQSGEEFTEWRNQRRRPSLSKREDQKSQAVGVEGSIGWIVDSICLCPLLHNDYQIPDSLVDSQHLRQQYTLEDTRGVADREIALYPTPPLYEFADWNFGVSDQLIVAELAEVVSPSEGFVDLSEEISLEAPGCVGEPAGGTDGSVAECPFQGYV